MMTVSSETSVDSSGASGSTAAAGSGAGTGSSSTGSTGSGSTGSGEGGSANAGAGSGGDDLDGLYASGNGLLCTAAPARGNASGGAPWLLAAIAALGLARRKRREV